VPEEWLMGAFSTGKQNPERTSNGQGLCGIAR